MGINHKITLINTDLRKESVEPVIRANQYTGRWEVVEAAGEK